MNEKNEIWERLIAWARRVPDDAENQPPLGFAARVVALAAERGKTEPLWEMLSLRALGLASLVAIATVAINFTGTQATAFDDVDAVDQAAAELFMP